ncbi:MAG TPA: SDR family oxidoreductase [Steroidobacteraceae bacterium]|nr:SDR family oxidoreductase [Steroidobacteraceae bacterium]
MKVAGKVIVVTGAAEGIGRALAERFRREGARHVAIADRNAEGARAVASTLGGAAYECDVSVEADLRRVIEDTEARHGPIDLFCSNAGLADPDPDPSNLASAPDPVWNRAWGVNVMAHVYAARLLVPRFAARGGGYFLNTVSAAGLLSQIGSAVYSTTKHAAVGFAESLAITHGDQGIKVSILCPQAVDTAMVRSGLPGAHSLDGVISPEEVSEAVIQGLDSEKFLILPHPQVSTYRARKAADYDRWLGGMRRLRQRIR